MKKIILLLFCMPLLLASTCEDDENQIVCTTDFVNGLNVTVVDSETQVPLVEGVTVTAVDGDYNEVLPLFPGLEYIFSGAGERVGSYIITVTKVGYITYTSQPIVVTRDVCHVIPKQVFVELVAD